MPGQKHIYVRAEDDALWQRASDYAKSHRLPMSALIMAALESYLAENDEASQPPK